MGIKNIYREIGPGKRVSLTKLAVQKFQETGRPLRIAIDFSIWQFQVQAARGGVNPGIRTLFYRLLRLLSLPIQPIFVFDGPNKPVFKRNKRSGRGDGVATAMAKRLIRLFGSMYHDAPGEAEAECALLQQSGIVDAVLSEDVDTIMFGCTRTLRNWSSEGPRTSKVPTHVSMYETEALSQSATGLDREGMVLVALMSGGDYIPEGIPGVGIKVACEAARAGFGKALCKIKRAETAELADWKEWLAIELRENISGFFRVKHRALVIPDDFPNMEVLRYYTHPVVSQAATLDRLRQANWSRNIDVEGLREFVRETFDWTYKLGAIKYIRVLAPCLLVRKFMQRNTSRRNPNIDEEEIRSEESELVRSITNRRAHASTDSTPELRISFIPAEIVGYDYELEYEEVVEFGRDGLALNSDDEMEFQAEELDEGDARAKSIPKRPFCPTEPDLLWMPEAIARRGIPLTVEDWEHAQQEKAIAKSKPKTKRKAKTGGMEPGALDKYVEVAKDDATATTSTNTKSSNRPPPPPPPPPPSAAPARAFIPPAALSPLPLAKPTLSLGAKPHPHPQKAPANRRPSKPSTSKPRSGPSHEAAFPRTISTTAPTITSTTAPPPTILNKPPTTTTSSLNKNTKQNPWTLSGSHSSPRVTKPAASASAPASKPILIPSSPPTPASAFPAQRPAARRPEHDYPNAGHAPHFPLELEEVDLTGSPSPFPPRKFARTESLPLGETPRRLFMRANTMGVQEDEDEDEFPSVENIVKAKRTAGKVQSSIMQFLSPGKDRGMGARDLSKEPPPRPPRYKMGDGPPQYTTGDPPPEYTTTEDPPRTFTREPSPSRTTIPREPTRMTKLYMPSQTEPGFFEEVEVSVEKAEAEIRRIAAPAGNRRLGRSVWRRSDISVVDLTGEV